MSEAVDSKTVVYCCKCKVNNSDKKYCWIRIVGTQDSKQHQMQTMALKNLWV